MENEQRPAEQAPLAFVAGGGEMGQLTREFDWSKNPLGPLADWPQSLKTAVSICLDSRFPIVLWIGPDLRLIYNDAWRPVLGQTKHPQALGSPGGDIWPEIWDIIGPMLGGVLATGQATWSDDQLLPLDRNGYLEEAYFTYSYSPIRDEGGKVIGVFAAVSETTLRVVGERRLRTLRELAAQASTAKTPDEAGRAALQTFAANPADVPFALLYFLDDDQPHARLCGCTPMSAETPASPEEIDLAAGGGAGWPVADVVESGRRRVVDDVAARFGAMPRGPLPVDPQQAVVLPLRSAALDRVAGVLVLGVNPGRALDDEHRSFFDLAAGHVAAAVANARAYEEERRRAEALAELDRAKTAFFSNVSHEFRTPLTLMLGPVEDLLAKSHTDLTPAAAGQLEVVNRNGLRLLRLVNTLLDFSRIEAGRVRAVYQPTDLAAFTSDLASVFRAAVERAGLRLVVDCPRLAEPVYVDREMWEKVVLNLLSNAFKFTFEGEIAVSLGQAGNAAQLRVRDTGTGIPAEEMPRLFERFHRVQNARGRTHEGSGIGLALVQELVRLHGGSVRAESVVGKGTTFTVAVPFGSAHLPGDQIGDGRTAAPTGTGATPYVEEALRWLPDVDEGRSELPTYHEPLPTPYRPSGPDEADDRARVLVADDNADMRQYVVRLLAERFRVEAVPDGEAALAAARERPPDLILTDVMMPRLTGFGLLQEVRADARTRNVPVIMLSARAGEESRVEGMEAGADDYLVKPFSARELLARVSAHLQMARLRREAGESLRQSEERFRLAAEAVNGIIYEYDIPTGHVQRTRGLYEVLGYRPDEVPATAAWWWEQIHPDDRQANRQRIESGMAAGQNVVSEYRVRHKDGRWLHVEDRAVLFNGDDGRPVKMVGCTMDVTQRVEAGRALREGEGRLRMALTAARMAAWHWNPAEDRVVVSDNIADLFGLPPGSTIESSRQGFPLVHPDDVGQHRANVMRAVEEGGSYLSQFRVVRPDNGAVVWMEERGHAVCDSRGKTERLLGIVMDITDRKLAEEAGRKRSEQVRRLAAVATRLSADLDIPSIMGVVTEEARRLIGSHQSVASMTTDPQSCRQEIVGVSLSDKYAGWRNYNQHRDGSGIYSLVCRTNRPMRLTQAELEAHPGWQGFGKEAGKHPPLRGWLAAPLVGRDGRNIGLIQLSDKCEGEFTEDDEAVLVQLAQMASVAVENARFVENLREEDRRKNEFLAILAHELRNPLAPLRNGLQVMKLASNDANAVEQSRTMMERQLGQMVRLIDDLLDVSRITRGKVALRKERVELAKVVQQAVETTRPLLEAAGLDLTINVPPRPTFVDADVTRLTQVFANLLNNAAKYTDRGGHIRLTVERQGRDAVVSVRDTGVGIPAHMLPRVFEMFTQVDRSLEKSQGGLGIGLSLVKGLVELHGGSVEARSEGHGMGSEFVVRLPVVLSLAGPHRDDEEADSVAPPARRRILVVDDNVDAATSQAMMLQIMGNETQTAHDGVEALDVAAAFRPDVILLDIGMPRMNGYDACRRLREQPWGKNIVIVACTGWGQEEDKRRSQEAGFNFHMVKPVDPAALEKLLAGLQATTG